MMYCEPPLLEGYMVIVVDAGLGEIRNGIKVEHGFTRLGTVYKLDVIVVLQRDSV
jgi:hypothetical protein